MCLWRSTINADHKAMRVVATMIASWTSIDRSIDWSGMAYGLALKLQVLDCNVCRVTSNGYGRGVEQLDRTGTTGTEE